MQIDFQYSDKLFRKYLSNKVKANRIVLVVSIVLYLFFTFLNRKGAVLIETAGKAAAYLIIIIIAAGIFFGVYGFLSGINMRKRTYNCQLQMEGNTITYMQISNMPVIAFSLNIGMQAWHMDHVTAVTEFKTHYLIEGEGVHVPDTRIMEEQKKITQFKVPKWFVGMEQLKQAAEAK